MSDRRNFLVSLAALPLVVSSGCERWIDFDDFDLRLPVVDVHAHFFNGRDVPVSGFLEQVVLRDPHSEVREPGLMGALIRLLELILLQPALFATEELQELREPGAAIARSEPSDARDRQAVARALETYSSEALDRMLIPARRRAEPADPRVTQDSLLLDALTRETGVDVLALATDGARPPAQALADAIFEPAARGGYRRRSKLVQTIRWAGLLTRNRRDIIAEYVRLYAGKRKVRIVSPSLVDFELWFEPGARLSPMADQVETMAELARRTEDLLLLNFIGFCPIRAALDRRARRDPLTLLKHAVELRGFAGVKVYPPLGFLPAGNSPMAQFGGRSGMRVSGAELNAALDELYNWCAANAVPIKAHAANSNAAGPCTGRNASPANWTSVLTRHPDLRLNLSHFGGFRETENLDACSDLGDRDWEDLFADLIGRFPGVYGDLGFWTEAYKDDIAEHARIQERVRALLRRVPAIQARLMFGTDWVMLGREPRHPEYVSAVRAAVISAGLDTEAVFSRNALDFLGLTGDTAQRRRLARFFGDGRLTAATAAE